MDEMDELIREKEEECDREYEDCIAEAKEAHSKCEAAVKRALAKGECCLP